MLTRRAFGLLVPSSALLLAPPASRAAGPATVHFANGSGFNDTQMIYLTAGMSRKLGYYAEEGEAVEMLDMSGNAANEQAVLTGVCDVGSFSVVGGAMNVIAEHPSVDLIVVYCWLRKPFWVMAVKEDSPFQSIRDLKGKTIGMRNAGDTGYVGGRHLLEDFGIDPDRDVSWIAVGEPGPAGLALTRGTVDALAYLDTGCVRMELEGIKLRFLPLSARVKNMPGAYFAVRKPALEKERDFFVRFFRGLAMSTLFAYTNPDVAIKLHWALYPETKPRDLSDAEAMKEARAVLDIRRVNWVPAPGDPDQRIGGMSKAEFAAEVAYMGLATKIPDVSPYFTTDLLDDANKFDHQAIINQAKAMTVADL